MRLASAIALEALAEQIREAEKSSQLSFYFEYEKLLCDSTSGVDRSATPEQID